MLLRIALRNTLRNKRRTAYTVAAVAFGLACLIVFQALKVGLHAEMVRSTVELDTGDIQIHARGFEPNLAMLLPLEDPARVAQVLASVADVDALQYSMRIRAPGLVLAGSKSSTVLVTGIDPEAESHITFLSERVTGGTYLERGGALVSELLAASLGVERGDEISLMVQDITGKARVRKYEVTGLYRTALASFDRSNVFLKRDVLSDWLMAGENADTNASSGSGPMATAAVVRTAGSAGALDADKLSRQLAAALGPDKYQVRTWAKIAPDVVQLIALNDSTMSLLILIVFAIVALGIVNTMSMSVFERFHEVGVMSSMGAGPWAVFRMFLYEAAFIGVFASLVGTAVGVAACAWLGRYGVDLSSVTAHNEYFATSHVLRARLVWSDLVWENGLTLLTATLAGVAPAIKAVRLEVVEALNHV